MLAASLDFDARDRRSLAIAGAALLLIVGIAAFFAPATESDGGIATTYSATSGGARAAWLLLDKAGYDVARWERPPANLPDAAGTVLILADPSTYPSKEDRDALQAFLSRGGRIIAAGMQAAVLFFEDRMVPEIAAGARWKQVPAVSPSAVTRAAPRITLLPVGFWPAGADGVPLYADEAGTRVVARRVGKGELILWASATPLTNAGMTEPGNLEFFLACLGPRATSRILWDEYFHGYRPSLLASVMRSPARWLFVHLALVTAAILFTYSRRHGPLLRAPAEPTRLSPLEFVRTLGGLYDRAHANSTAVDIAYSRFRYAITRRLGIAVDAPPAAIDVAVRARHPFAPQDLGAILSACESARVRPDLRAKEALGLVRALHRCAAALQLFGPVTQRAGDEVGRG